MIIVVIGVAGSGKTTVGTMLADAMNCPFLEGDSLHSKENIDKMSHGIPLTDADRAPWLAAIHARILDCFERGQDLVVGCSALKQAYRTVLAEGIPITWVYLKGSPALIRSRLKHRTGHFMKADMLASQFDALEEPSDALVVDVSEPPGAIVEQILAQLRGPTHPAHRSLDRPTEGRRMNAIAVVPGTKTVRLVDRPEPAIVAPDDIKLRVLRVGICGTDREEAAGGRAKAPPAHDDLVLGHEMFGQVMDVGRAVTLVKPGDYAVFTVRRGCGPCRSCAMNRSDMCRTGLYAERGIWGWMDTRRNSSSTTNSSSCGSRRSWKRWACSPSRSQSPKKPSRKRSTCNSRDCPTRPRRSIGCPGNAVWSQDWGRSACWRHYRCACGVARSGVLTSSTSVRHGRSGWS